MEKSTETVKHFVHANIFFEVLFMKYFFRVLAVQNERQPRNTATIQTPSESEMYAHANFFRFVFEY